MGGKTKRAKQADKPVSELTENLAAFTLPESLPCSEISFPVLIQRRPKANWNAIVEESQNRMREIQHFVSSKKPVEHKSPFQRTECDYIKDDVFTYLLPALEGTLNKAKMWNALHNQRCFFNGIDWIAQELWNNNPRHPERKFQNLHLFNMPWVREHLKRHPRPYYPKSWLWPEEYAATLIQKTVRQYFVQRDEEVQEMREFWKKLELEKHIPAMDQNYFLARKFASERNFNKRLSKTDDSPKHTAAQETNKAVVAKGDKKEKHH